MRNFPQAAQEYCHIPLPHGTAQEPLAAHAAHSAKHFLAKHHWQHVLFGKRTKSCRENALISTAMPHQKTATVMENTT